MKLLQGKRVGQMNQKIFKIGILIIALLALAAGFFLVVSKPGSASSFSDGDQPQVTPDWQQVNNSGFGDQQVEEVSAVEVLQRLPLCWYLQPN